MSKRIKMYNIYNMNNKKITFGTIIIFIFFGIIFFLSINNNSKSTKNTVIKSTSTIPKTFSINSNSTVITYPLSTVAKHNNETSCWTVIDGNIYDITSYISSHPAGTQKILQGCGIDATNLYGKVGAHDVSKLSSVIVGKIK